MLASNVYQIFRDAIANKQQIVCTYRGLRREVCPHALGLNTKGTEQVLTFQFAGDSSSGLPPGGEWRCMLLSEVTGAQTRGGPWHTGATHGRPQTCVKVVDIEVSY